MGMEINLIKEYLRGSNPLIPDNGSMIKTTPPGNGSRLIKIQETNHIYEHFTREIGGVKLMAVGPFDEGDLGVKCYHSKTGSVEMILNHLIDGEEEYAIVDMTAGADSFSSGLFTRFDITFLVVEPTLKSVSVYSQYKQYARDHNVTIKVIGNKIEDESDVEFLKKHTGEDLVAVMSQSMFVKKIDRGEWLSLSKLELKNRDSLIEIIKVINSQKKDWHKFYNQAFEFHIKNAKSWANASSGKDLTKQIDPTFTMSFK
jgi:CO dehydrogenase maturation factor